MKGGEIMKTQHIVIGIVAVLLIGGGIVFFNSQSAPKDSSSAQNSSSAKFQNQYLAYSPENLTKAQSNNGKAVIFFHAGWCPTCIAAERDFKVNFDKVPENVTILQTDYDTSKELKQKYNVTYQDTFVQVDSQGNEVTKWSSGGQGVGALLANLK